MLTLDTNALARYFLNDDLKQLEYVAYLIDHFDCFVPITVTLELCWVLASKDKSNVDIIEGILLFSKLPHIYFEELASLKLAFQWVLDGMDMADAIHLSIAQTRKHLPVATFDKNFIRKSKKISHCPPCQNIKDIVQH